VTSSVEVSELTHPRSTTISISRRRVPIVRNQSSVIGIAGTVLLHGMAVPSLILGTVAHKFHRPDIEGVGVERTALPIAPADALVLITLADNSKPDADPLGGAARLKLQFESIQVPITAPPLRSVSFESADLPSDVPAAMADAGDAATRALMFGRYMGQISTRIERAWMRPRSPVNEIAQGSSVAAAQAGAAKTSADGDQTFRCDVQIRQDAHGNVEEVLLLDCNGTEAWRHSLVTAINQASPLPAPPTPKVFTRALTMSFEGHAYGSRDPEGDYEPGSR
jgi:hypothetical protein